jgi:hypothetical protein
VVRILFWTPFVDRYAHTWMWFRGGWDFDPPEELGDWLREFSQLTPLAVLVESGGRGIRIHVGVAPEAVFKTTKGEEGPSRQLPCGPERTC